MAIVTDTPTRGFAVENTVMVIDTLVEVTEAVVDTGGVLWSV